MNNLLQIPPVLATRRNHALEHATIHILSNRFPGSALAGHSNPTGFMLLGEVPTEAVRAAVHEAISRLQNGESALAIHPGCGTNYLVMGGLAAFLGIIGTVGTKNTRERLERLPLLTLLSILGIFLGQPLGPALQKQITTEAAPGSLAIVDVYRLSGAAHRIVTRA